MKWKALLLSTIVIGGDVGASVLYPGLFARVVDIGGDDALNVRKSPNYRSEKVGSLPPGIVVGIEKCRRVKDAIWCEIFSLQGSNEAFEEDIERGWVNARYLAFENRGYVVVDDKPACRYAIDCEKDRCDVAVDYTMDKHNRNILFLRLRQIDRKRLRASNRFDAMPRSEEASGYCNDDILVEAYLMRKKLHRIVAAIDNRRMEELAAFVHPIEGVRLTWNVSFGGKEDKRFRRSDIANAYRYRSKQLYWGKAYGSGREIGMSLYAFLSMLTIPKRPIDRIKRLETLKGFSCPKNSECLGYEIFWSGKDTKSSIYDWQGLVVIFEKYRGQWYVVGMLRDRWTI